MLRAINAINILLGIAIITMLAFIAAERLSNRLGTVLPKKAAGPAAGTPAPPAAKTEDLSFYAPILSNGLFGKAMQGQLSPIVATTAAAQAAPVTAPSELLLLGTATGSFRETFALVRHSTKQEERVFRLGDMVFDAGRLAEVKKDQAFIVINGKKVELLTPMTPPSAAPAGQPASPAPSGGGVTSTGAGSFVIDQRALNAALDNIGQAMTDARLLPSQKDGKVEGFRASEVKPNGVFAMIGIRNGDVLLRLNDFPIDSPDKALQSFMALKGQSKLKLDLIRDGQPATFNYDIR
ncbi:type II secretion system protein GspC [Geobacter sp. SVR]|uniref:type II secretion system protein GspC n=1 Tax=Geobacter sp. SVR TaxID=2495594 RepID=UPI00143EF8A8|nr:type II secretion system protein GspC [Geobacter sp. SVR]BCS55843.1 general secretion pathway protein GspC [Geobacter sp. SVR]GCF83847.1 general secretion pathway protein GspC [Geobacter sp. SVR]